MKEDKCKSQYKNDEIINYKVYVYTGCLLKAERSIFVTLILENIT